MINCKTQQQKGKIYNYLRENNNMNVVEVGLGVFFTVIGSLTIAIMTLRLQDRKYKRRLFKALYKEIKRNRKAIQTLLERRKNETTQTKISLFEISYLYSFSYQTIWLTGELLSLHRPLREDLESTYELIDLHNRQLSTMDESDVGRSDFNDRLHKMENKLQKLEDDLPGEKKYLKEFTKDEV